MRIYIIIAIVVYLLYKLGLFKSLTGGDGPSDGNIRVDKTPPNDKKRSSFDGGEYVDYEEVK